MEMKINDVPIHSVCGHYVLIKPDKIEDVSEGGIIIHAGEYQKKLEENAVYTGTVIGFGESAWYDYTHKYGKKEFARWAEVGDHVLYTKHGGRHIEIPCEDGELRYVVVRDGDVLLVLRRAKDE